MEEQQKPQEHELNPRLRWVGAVIGVGFLFFTVQTVWKYGLHDWDWVLNAALAAMGFSFLENDWRDPTRPSRWYSRILHLAWGFLFIAYVAHWQGLVVALCMAGVLVLQTIAPMSSYSLTAKNPLGALYWLLIIFLAGWFVRGTNEWVPLSCVLAIALLLAYQRPGRRSMKQNLLRPASVSWIALAATASLWFWKEPSFAGGLLLFAIPILWFGNLLIHLSPGEPPLALPHPQS
jgi:hypothetical protein